MAGAHEIVGVGNIGPDTDWREALTDVDMVVHLAARVHVMRESSADPLGEFRLTNRAGTAKLALAAAEAGVHRMVFVSSIKVNGEATPIDQPFSETSVPQPQDPYAVSKWEAEQALIEIAGATSLEVVILRPALVYGPGVAGNFIRMLKAVRRNVPLPFASVENRRSYIYVANLVDAIGLCLTQTSASGNTYLVSDGENVSTPELLLRLGKAVGTPVRLLPVPEKALRMFGRLLRKTDELDRLTGSLVVDSSRIRRELSWCPRFSMADGLQATANWFGQL